MPMFNSLHHRPRTVEDAFFFRVDLELTERLRRSMGDSGPNESRLLPSQRTAEPVVRELGAAVDQWRFKPSGSVASPQQQDSL